MMNLKIVNNHKYSKTYMKYLISYVLILLVPVIILSFIVFGIFIERLKNEVMNNTVNSLNKSKMTIDMQIQQLYGTSYQILNANTSLKSYLLMEDSTLRDQYIRNELRKHIVSNFFISEFIFYLENDKYVYTTEGVYPLKLFINSIYDFEYWDQETFIQDISKAKSAYIRPAEKVNGEESYITFVYPSYRSTNIRDSSLLFLIREQKVKELLSNTVQQFKGNSLILNKDNKVITAIDNNEYINSYEFQDLISSLNEEDTILEKRINGVNFYIVATVSKELGWKYISLLPVEAVMADVGEVQVVYILGLISVFVLGIITILYCMRLNYQPIKQLKSYIEKTLNKDEDNRNEIETVREAIDFLALQNQKLSSDFKKNISALKDSLLFSLIKGQITTLEEFNKYGKEIGMEFTKPYSNIIIVHAIEKETKGKFDRQILGSIIDQYITENYEYYIRDNIEENEYILLLASDEKEHKELNPFLDRIMNKVKHDYKALLTMGVGEDCYQFHGISKSYISASTALKYKFVRGNGKIIYYSEINAGELKMEDYPHKSIAELTHFIKQGNISRIHQFIESITDYIRKSDVPIFIARGLCFEVIYEVINSDKDIGMQIKYPDIFLLEKIETLDELLEIIKAFCLDICAAIKEKRNDSEMDLIDQIILFIEQNYDNCSFNNQMIAENFGMTVSYLSQYFKSKTEKTILDFATELRIGKAKELLTSTDLSLNHISEEVGYYNASSFIRRFKQVMGITPGEYRKRAD